MVWEILAFCLGFETLSHLAQGVFFLPVLKWRCRCLWWRTVADHQLFLETHMLHRLCSQATANKFVQRWDLLPANSCLLNHVVSLTKVEVHLNLPWKIQVIPPLRISAVLLPGKDTDIWIMLNTHMGLCREGIWIVFALEMICSHEHTLCTLCEHLLLWNP